MTPPSRGYRFGPATDVEEALAFHRAHATGPYLWPRSEDQLREYAEDELLVGAWETNTGAMVGLCYSKWDPDENVWEAGGITVHGDHQGQRLGPTLFRIALGSTLVNEQPWKSGHAIIAHVHANNDSPVRMMQSLGFFEHGTPVVTTAGGNVPANMELIGGYLIGRVFWFSAKGMDNLCTWFQRFDGRLTETTNARLDFGQPGNEGRWLQAMREALADMREQLAAGGLLIPNYDPPQPEAPLDDVLVKAAKAGEITLGKQSPWLNDHLARLTK